MIDEIEVNLIDKKKLEKEHVLKIQIEILEILCELVQMSIIYETIFNNDLLPLKKIHLLFRRSLAVYFTRKEYLWPGTIDDYMQTYVKDILKKLGRPIPDRVQIKHLHKLVLSGRGEKKVIKLEL